MENQTATELLGQTEKLASFIDMYSVSCSIISGPKRWRASVYRRSNSYAHTSDGNSPEEAMRGLKNQLTDIANKKIVDMMKQIQDMQEIIRFGN